MQIPIVVPAPVVATHAVAFRDLFENRCQFRHFQNYLTGLMVLDNKSMANICRCVLDSADKTNLSRFFSEAPWFEHQINDRRIKYMLSQTRIQRQAVSDSYLVLDDTLCEHVGSLFDYVDRHYNHSLGSYPLAHNPVTSYYVSGAVRFPLSLRLYRRYEECTQWEKFVKKQFPDKEIPKQKKARNRLHKEVDAILMEDKEFRALHEQFRTKIELAVELIEQAIFSKVLFSCVLMDSWYLSTGLIEALKQYHLDWVSILKKNRNLETASFVLKDAEGHTILLKGPHIKVEDLVPLIPANAYKKVEVNGKVYYCFTLSVRIPKLGKVRLVISFENPELTGVYVVLVTNRVDWNAKKVIDTYLQRWPIETFYQDGKGHLGLDEYRMRNAEAIGKHWCLVFVAYSLLHLDCLPPSLVKGKALPIKSIGEACRQQAQVLIQELILVAHNWLEQGYKAEEVFERLFAKQGVVLNS